MQLTAFRVQNYKKIRDTGWVNCERLVVFVGKNESGKSAIFRGLSKLNPSDAEPYDGLKEFPRRRYTDEFHEQDWPVASARFKLTDPEKAELAGLVPGLKDLEHVEVTRKYSGRYVVGFQPAPEARPVRVRELKLAITAAMEQIGELVAPKGRGPAMVPLKQNLTTALQGNQAALTGDGNATAEQAQQVVSAISSQIGEAWQKRLTDPAFRPLKDLASRAALAGQLGDARTWVVGHLPRFIYFDRYDVLESAIHIPTFLQQVAGTPRAPRVRATQCLFKHVGLDLATLAGLGQHTPGQAESEDMRRQIDERAILMNSASEAMTEKFRDWWEQRRHRFHYQLDGDYFRTWVSDDLDPSQIELDQRSAGLQYFFSFYTVFLVESAEAHSGSILLLDEPALQLHGTAQASIVRFLQKLCLDNQTFYSTHSPFMIDADHLERARAVYETEDGTTGVSEDVWPRDRDSLFPLQAALGYQLAQALFVSSRQVVLEGLTDFWLLKALDVALAKAGLERLRPEITLVPSGGISKLLPLASMLLGHDIEVAALLDGDEPARREGKRLRDKLLAGDDRRCLFIGDFIAYQKGEIEDIFSRDVYLDVVREAYPEVELDFTAEEQALPGVVSQVKTLFARKGLEGFEKWRAAAILRDRILESPDSVDSGTLDTVARINSTLNLLLS